MKHTDPRPSLIGSDTGPEAPFPLKLEGPVVKGFGRGSKELGIPTANIPISGLSVAGHTDLASGVYFGYCSLQNTRTTTTTTAAASSTSTPIKPSSASLDSDPKPDPSSSYSEANPAAPPPQIYEMVMSIGWNPFYKNTVRSVEVHVLHAFAQDFYGLHLRLLIVGFVREELDYVSREALVQDIRTDIQVARDSLARERWGVEVLDGEAWLGR